MFDRVEVTVKSETVEDNNGENLRGIVGYYIGMYVYICYV